MNGRSYQSTSSIKRKALPALPSDATHSRTISDASFHGDSLPLVPIDNRVSWSPPPASSDIDLGYETSRRLDPRTPVQTRDDRKVLSFNRGSPYSKLVAGASHHYETDSVQNNPLVFQNAIPQGDDEQRGPPMWNPIWLDSLVLSAFILLFLTMLAGLIILWHFVKRENGLSTIITDNHYAWTYGPTALLVVIGVAWKQVDFYCRILTPWLRLRHGPATAQNTILLDYISPMLPKALGAAAANRDWAVVASGTSTILLKIVTVFSTGLLVLTPTTVSRSLRGAFVNSKFAGTDYIVDTSISDTQLMRYYGIQEQGLNYQYGTTADVAYDTIDLKSVIPNSMVTTTVDGVFPFFDCEIVEPTIVGDNFTWGTANGEIPTNELSLTLTLSPSKCPPLRASYTLCTAPDCNLGQQYIDSDEVWNLPGSYNPFKPLADLDPCANLYQLTLAELSFEKIAGQPANSSAAWKVSMPTAVGIVCALGYTIDTVNVTVNTANPTTSDGVNTTGPLHRVVDVLPGFSYQNLTAEFQNHVGTADSLPTPIDARNIGGFAKLFAIMNAGSAAALLNATTLKTTAERAFKGVAVQLAHTYLRKDGNATTTADAVYLDQRLQIRILSVWGMAVGLVLLSISALAILVWRPRDAIPHNPSSIARQASLLAASPELRDSLNGMGSLSDAQLQMHLSSSMAASVATNHNEYPTFCVETTSSEEKLKVSLKASKEIGIWWRPSATRLWFMAPAVVLPGGVIIVLELLQRKSDSHDGFASTSASSIVDHSLPSIFASAVMISVAMMYDAINFTTATLAPYQALQENNSAAKRTLLSTSLLGDMPLWSTLHAIRNRYGSAAIASLATIIASLLTINASGLYTIETAGLTSNINLVTSDHIVPSFSTLTDGGAGGIFTLIEHNNASYPALTYDELVFPSIAVSSLGEKATKQLAESEIVTLQVSIPAVRAALNCTVVPRDTIIRNNTLPPTANPDTLLPDSTVYWTVPLPETCPHFLDGNNETATDIPFEDVIQYLNSEPYYIGNILPSANGPDLDEEFGTTLGAASNPPGCPSLAFMFGFWVVNSTSTENITAMTCIQGFEQVHTTTTFVVSKGSFQVKSPPIVNESSAQWLYSFNSTKWFTSETTFDSFIHSQQAPDAFYQQVTNGIDGVPPEELVGPENTDRFVNATQHVYRQYMAQLINSNMRQPFNSTEAAFAPTYPAMVLDINVLRLKQNATSKLILQILLGIMLACGVLVYSWRNMRHVLPHCPWSIAGMMSLLVGSEMIDRKIIPAGAEFMSDQDLAKCFEGYLFSLGWWDAAGKTGRRFGVDVGKPRKALRS